jgi:hypothetical protein
VQSHAHPDRAARQPVLRLAGGGERVRGHGKGEEERVALGVDLGPAAGSEGGAEATPVRVERRRVGLGAELLQQARRPLHVGEEQRYGAGGQRPYRLIMRLRRPSGRSVR